MMDRIMDFIWYVAMDIAIIQFIKSLIIKRNQYVWMKIQTLYLHTIESNTKKNSKLILMKIHFICLYHHLWMNR